MFEEAPDRQTHGQGSLVEMEPLRRTLQPLPEELPHDASTTGHSRDDVTLFDNVVDNNNHNSTEAVEQLGQETHTIATSPEKTLRRKLRSIHLFMISINGTLGIGLYVRSGQILELGRPIAVVLSFLFNGALAWAVMQCITELLSMWPVPGALPLFVEMFVDKELSTVVGVAYWYTYSIGFAALTASTVGILNYWTEGIPGFTEGVIYFVLLVILVFINTFEVTIYGWIEVVTGVIKMTCVVTIACFLIAIYFRSGLSPGAEEAWKHPVPFDPQAAVGWPEAFIMSLSIAIFAYTGVEIIAVSAIEARWQSPSDETQPIRTNSGVQPAQSSLSQNSLTPDSPRRNGDPQRSIKSTIQSTAVWVPVVVAGAYLASGVLVSLDLKRDDCGLPRLSWVKDSKCGDEPVSSPFILVAERSDIAGLEHAFNAFIFFTAVTCANTNLYVASRTLFALTRNIKDTGPIRFLRWLGETNKKRVPQRAMFLSASAFCWVPFLQLVEGSGTDLPTGKLIEILGQMGSVGIIIVWACQCLAYIRYYHCINKYRVALEREGIYPLQNHQDESRDYPYRSHWQPVLAYLALGGCLFALVVCNGAFLWKEFHILPFLSGYLTHIVFLTFWFGLKIFKRAQWSFIHLDETTIREVITHLDDQRAASMKHQEAITGQSWALLWRLLRSPWNKMQLRN